VRTLVAAILFLTLAASAMWTLRPARAAATPSTAYISGLHIDGSKSVATIRITNTSKRPADFYTISYAIFHADGNRAAPSNEIATTLLSGKSLTLDVGPIVDGWRRQQEALPFKGPVQVVIFGISCADTGTCPLNAVPDPFGPEVVHIEAVQTEGAAVYDAVVQWRTGN
jgi:hypothetical protein